MLLFPIIFLQIVKSAHCYFLEFLISKLFDNHVFLVPEFIEGRMGICFMDDVWFVAESARKYYVKLANLLPQTHGDSPEESINKPFPFSFCELSCDTNIDDTQHYKVLECKQTNRKVHAWLAFITSLCEENCGCIVATRILYITEPLLVLLRYCTKTTCCKILNILIQLKNEK